MAESVPYETHESVPCWRVRRGSVSLDRPLVMGILNTTPDSFSDGGTHASVEAATAHARQMIAEGTDWIDIGGESTRPGAAPVPVDEELRRVVPVVRAIRAFSDIPLSVDTSKAAVAAAALDAGADVVNDVTALADPAMAGVVRDAGAGVVLMHGRGTPLTMDALAEYGADGVAASVARELLRRVAVALDAGIAREAICLDPGFGFAKTSEQNEELLRDLGRIAELGWPLLVGVSRKRFVAARMAARGEAVDPPAVRDAESAAIAAQSVRLGAHIVRVHNVAETRRVLGGECGRKPK